MAKSLQRHLEKIEARENTGPYGARRRDFCRKYREVLVQTRANSHKALVKKLASKGEKITCRKGCTYCCFHYVAVPLAHGIVIVDYLYNKKGLIHKFIHNYEKWHQKGHAISKDIDLTRTRAFSSAMSIDEVIAVTRPSATRYLELDIPCPFLDNNACFIYAVRPMPCSGQYSVSPPHWCARTTAEQAVIHQLVPDDEDLLKFLQLADPQLMIHEVTLPILIYRLLTEGTPAIIQSSLQNSARPGL